jgi:hypothetical protein
VRLVAVGALLLAGACTGRPTLFRAAPEPSAGPDSLYWRALSDVNPANSRRSLEMGIANLDVYLTSKGVLRHANEATVLRDLAREAQRLAKVEGALLQSRATAAGPRPRAEPEPRGRDEEAVKEIQRLKEELTKANEELERIRKRLAAPKP